MPLKTAAQIEHTSPSSTFHCWTWHQHMYHPCWTQNENNTQKILQQILKLWALRKHIKEKNSRSNFTGRDYNNVGKKLQQTFRNTLLVSITISAESLNQNQDWRTEQKYHQYETLETANTSSNWAGFFPA